MNRMLSLSQTGLMGRIGPVLLLTCAASAQELTTATLDAGGAVTSGGDVVVAGSLGGIGGISSDTGSTTARAGFPGQLYAPASLSATPAPAVVLEGGTLQLTPVIVCDDDTTLSTVSASVMWEADSSFFSIGSATGLITAGNLPGDRTETVRLTAAGLTGDISVSLLDVTPDNYGSFAGDNLDDTWQWDWFAADPASGAPASDPDNDGQDNALEFLTGTTPLDGGSFLRVRMESEPLQPAVRQLFFEPFRPDRTYRWEWSDNLQSAWQPVIGDRPELLLNGEARATDDVATGMRKFYRLIIE